MNIQKRRRKVMLQEITQDEMSVLCIHVAYRLYHPISCDLGRASSTSRFSTRRLDLIGDAAESQSLR